MLDASQADLTAFAGEVAASKSLRKFLLQHGPDCCTLADFQMHSGVIMCFKLLQVILQKGASHCIAIEMGRSTALVLLEHCDIHYSYAHPYME